MSSLTVQKLFGMVGGGKELGLILKNPF